MAGRPAAIMDMAQSAARVCPNCQAQPAMHGHGKVKWMQWDRPIGETDSSALPRPG